MATQLEPIIDNGETYVRRGHLANRMSNVNA